MESISGRSPMVAYWLHTGFLMSGDNAKMSKSLGNFETIRDVVAEIPPRVLRFAFFSQHYRSSMTLTPASFEQAASSLARLDRFIEERLPAAGGSGEALAVRQSIDEALNDDFDTPRALARMFELVRDQNREQTDRAAAQALVADVLGTFGLSSDKGSELLDSEIDQLIRDRDRYRRERRFKEADEIRERLTDLGIALEDSPDGVKWRRKHRL